MASRSLGITLLVLGTGGTLVGGLVFGAPGLVRDLVAPPPIAVSEAGPRPELPEDLAAVTAPQEARQALLTPLVLQDPPRAITLAPAVSAKTAAPVIKAERGYAADAAAREAVTEAERRYRAMDWIGAVNTAKPILALDANPALKARARELIEQSALLADLFKTLDDREELTRSYDTHPSLVRIDGGREVMYALPIRSLADKEPLIIEKDPLGYIAQARTTGKVPLLVRGRKEFFPTGLTDIGTVRLVDQAVTLAEKRKEFLERMARLTGSSTALDALVWYEAGRFAYRNRLDDLVVPQLEQAIRLDPKLVTSVREDRAAGLFAHLMAQMKAGNKVQASSYMAMIDRRYKDTEQGRQARLFFDGKQEELLVAVKASEAVVPPSQEIVPPPVTPPPTAVPPASTTLTPEAQADQVLAQGREVYARAIDAGNTKERDVLYGDADRILSQAVQMYSVLVSKEKVPRQREALEMKLLEANKLRFGCKKQRRF